MNKEINAQEYLEKNSDPTQETVISSGSLRLLAGEKLTGDLVIQDYPQLEEIDLSTQELTSLTVINCPNLKQINARNNQLTKLELNAPELQEIIAGQNELTTLDLSNCQKLKKLIIPDNPTLTEIKGLNLATINSINIANTLINLTTDYEKLIAEKEELLKSVKTLKEAAEEKGWVLTRTVQNSIQAEEAIQELLIKTEKEWREGLKHPENALPSFQLPETRRITQELLLAIIQAKVSHNYQKLVEDWDKRIEKGEEDFTGVLGKLKELLRAKNYLKNKEIQPLKA